MKDPFFCGPFPWLSDATKPWADSLGLTTLPLHIHEVLIAFALYSLLYYPISPLISSYLFPRHYPSLPRKTQLNWDTRVVSLVQSTLVNVLALWVIVVDDERRTMDREERIWGYTGAAGMIQGLAAGYFLWDLCVSGLHVDIFGTGTLVHAIGALAVYMIGFRPFMNYYGCIFILWELSTPFLNFHWFFDKLQMTGSRAQLYNGIALLFTFFSCRLVWGVYESTRVWRDIWNSMDVPSSTSGMSPLKVDLLRFTHGGSRVPVWMAAALVLSNLTLNFLNYNWFFKMIRAIRKRFPAEEAGSGKAEDDAVDTSRQKTEGGQVRRRKVR